uniref:uncharacterized protein LOC105350079 n=1 Tax=Fragaria vesca subsp. vesca TaxID=101020 RepID=UPI0005CB4B4C|nr:PREDICTED: uncharacterized protein LOC105350079 [Fragaria vesca subsp. vesca]
MEQLQPPPPPAPVYATQQAYTTHSGHGSVGPLIAVLAVITVLGVIAGMIGRLCSGRRIMGHGQHYDFEAWLEKKCSSCIDGRIAPPPPPPHIPATASVEEVPAAEPEVESVQEIKEEERVSG